MVKMIAKSTIQTSRIVRESQFAGDPRIVDPVSYAPGEEFEVDAAEAKRLEDLGVAERATKAARDRGDGDNAPGDTQGEIGITANEAPASGDTRAPDSNAVAERSRLGGKPRG